MTTTVTDETDVVARLTADFAAFRDEILARLDDMADGVGLLARKAYDLPADLTVNDSQTEPESAPLRAVAEGGDLDA